MGMLATDTEGRHKALVPIKEFQMHEFMPHGAPEQAALAPKLGQTAEWVSNRVHSLAEANPMLGHRGVRLGITYPEIYEAQVESVFEAAVEAQAEMGVPVVPEVMIPLVGKKEELALMKAKCVAVAESI